MKSGMLLVMVGLVLLVQGEETIGVNRKTYSSATQFFGDVETVTLFAQLDLDEDLEVSYDLFCSSQNYKKFSSYKSNPGCLPCNYTGEQTSDGKCSDINMNPSLPQFQGLGLSNCPCNPTYCQGTVINAGDEPQHYIIRESDLRLVFRYEHTDFDSGFAVKLTPVDEGPVNFLVANALSLDPEHTLAYSYSTAAYEYLKVCPSFNRFGAGSESITYFIIVLPGDLAGNEMASFNISVEVLPSLTEDEEGDYQLLEFLNGTAASMSPELGQDPFYIEGTYLSDYYDGNPPEYYPLLILVPLTKCVSYSISFEYTYLNTSQFDYFSLVDTTVSRISQSNLELFYETRDRPFKLEELVEFSHNETKVVGVTSEGRIFSDCPTPGITEPQYIFVRISPGPAFSDWGMLVNFRATTPDSRTRLNRKLSELQPLVYQRLLREEINVRCPCNDPCDKCDSRDATEIRYFNRLSGLTPETFPALNAKSEPGCDLVAEIGVPVREYFLLQCHSYWRDSSCGIIRVIPVFSSVNPRIYPMPLVIRLLQRFSFSVSPDFLATQNIDDLHQIESNSIGVLFTISANGVTYFDTERLINDCEMRISYPTIFHNSNDRPPTGDYFPFSSFEKYSPECTQEGFLTISTLLSSAESELNLLTQSGVLVGAGIGGNGDDLTAEELFESSSSATYASYSLLFSQQWQSCQELADSFLISEEKNQTIDDSSQCGLNYDPDDPCCNTDLQWEECCDPEGREILTTQVNLLTNEDQLEAVCEDSRCMETFADDYGISYKEVVFEGICQNEFTLDTGLNRVVSECREYWIGSDEFGKLCYSDVECQELFETDKGSCDLSVNRCVGIREEMELGFSRCLLRDVDSVTRSAIVNEMAKAGIFFERNEALRLAAAKLRNYLINEMQCVSDYGPMSHLRARFVAQSLNEPDEQLCPVCYDLYCLSPYGCDWPLQCLDKRQLCGATIVPYTSPFCVEPTEDTLQCDYNASLTKEECDLDTPFCQYCFNSSHCVPLPADNQEECENTPICIMPGGEILWDVTEEECKENKICTEKCLGETCLDQESCEQIGGFCEDPDAILDSIIAAAKVDPSLENATKGVCVTPIKPFNTPACPYVTENVIAQPGAFDFRTGNSWDFTTHRGCVVFSNCIPVSIQFADGTGAPTLPHTCEWQPNNIQTCEEEYDGIWLELPIQTQQACENPLNANEDDFPGYCLEDNTGESPYFSRKDNRECKECGGVPLAPAKWRGGRWLGGEGRVGVWRTPEMVSPYHYVSDSISFHALNNLLSLSSANVNSFLNDVSIACGVSPFADYLSLFSCNCGPEPGDNDCEGILLQEDKNIIGGAWLCPNVTSKVGLAVGTIEVNGSEITGAICKFSEVALAPAEVFVGNHKRVPLTVLGDPNPIDAEPVRNKNGATVGGVVGDGMQFYYENTGFVDFESEVNRLKLTLFIDTKILRDFPPYYVFDFGIEVLDEDKTRFPGEIELRPLATELLPNPEGAIFQETTVGELLDSVGSEEVVGLTGYWVQPFNGQSPRLYPIVRQRDYEQEPKNDVLSDGEKAMVGVFSALYGLATIISIGILCFLFLKAPSLTNLVFSFFIFLAFLFRCVYLALYASGELREEDISSFILVEPPSFFILSVASVLAMSFGFCLHCIKKNVPQEKAFARFWGYWGIFNIFLYLVLAVVLLLETLLDIDDEVTISCYGRRVEVEESFTIQAIRIGYHSFLLLIAIITAFALFFLGRSLEANLEYTSLSSLSIVSGVSVLLSNILWVIYSGLSGSSPYFVIPLFFVEVPPLILIMLLVLPKEE